MREFKFRVWDNWVNKFMVQEYRKFWQSKGYGATEMSEIFLFPQSSANRFIIQQFTGAKDKNGKEIYEGDIIKVSRSHVKDIEISPGHFRAELIEDGIEVGKVIWMDFSYCFCVSYEHIRYDDTEPFHGISHRYEIIGNIFENPSLLNK